MKLREYGNMQNIRFTAPLRSLGAINDQQCLDAWAELVTMDLSLSCLGPTVAPDDCFLIYIRLHPLTESSDRKSHCATPNLPKQADSCTVLLLSPGGSFESAEENAGEFLQCSIPVRSLEAFAAESGVAITFHPASCSFTHDPLLQVLSRVAQRLLALAIPITERSEDMHYFTLSFFAHLMTFFGSDKAASSKAVGGLSKKHKTLVQNAVSSTALAKISVADLAKLCGLSTGHFSRAFRQSFGSSVHRHLTSLRMRHARQLLTHSALSLKEIAQKVGYADQATFTESFKRLAGSAPGRFRRQYGNALCFDATAIVNGPQSAVNPRKLRDRI